MTVRAQEVFTPGAFPSKTYVARSGENSEQALRDALDTPGQIVSLNGPSKSGKTVLIERVVGPELLIPITGAGITSPDDIWTRVLDWMRAPLSSESGSTTSGSVGVSVGAKASAGVPLIAKGEAEGSVTAEGTHERAKSTTVARRGLAQVVEEIAGSEYTVLIDDFHYMHRDVQAEAAKSLKEAVRLGVRLCTAAVVHRGDDLVRANPELRGRVRAVDLRYWKAPDLRKIAEAGFDALNADIDPAIVDALVAEAAGSPQLMQLLCLHACFVFDIRRALTLRRRIEAPREKLREIFEQASSATDFRSLVDVLDAGPKTRGQERKLYKFKDGSQGDVYRAVLKAAAHDPPRLAFHYDDLLRRVAHVCAGEPPSGSSIVSTCVHMTKLALESFPRDRAIDWDEQKQILDIPDPYLAFYLRWSGRLSEAE